MKINWRRTTYIVLDSILAVYLLLAITAFNKPEDKGQLCEEVVINISDESTNGFLTSDEIKRILVDKKLYPKNQPLKFINPRSIEELLKVTPFVNTAQCYKTEGGKVFIEITQRTPIIRIKSINGEDYYIDDKGGIMPNSKYTSDLIIATGYITKPFARTYITLLIDHIMKSDFWRNQIEQINVLQDQSIEIVPRVGDHIVLIGKLPNHRNIDRRSKEVEEFITRKLERLEKFYKYGLSQVGWNRYKYINIEFDNQIICKRNSAYNDSQHKPKAEAVEMETDSVSADSTKQSTKPVADSKPTNNQQPTIKRQQNH